MTMITLTLDEMIAEWRLRNQLDPTVMTAVISTESGLAVDEIARRAIDDWYYNLLDNGPAAWIPTTDLSQQALAQSDSMGVVTVTLPPACRRVVGVKLAEWQRGAEIITDPSSAAAIHQSSEYIRGGCCRPKAIVDGNRLTLYSSESDEPRIDHLLCVMEPQAGIYILDRAALATIPIL